MFLIYISYYHKIRQPQSWEDYIVLGIVFFFLLWLMYDVFFVYWSPRIYIRRKMAEIQNIAREKLVENLTQNLANFSLEEIPSDAQKIPYLHSLKPWINEYLKTEEIQQQYLKLTLINYQNLLIKNIFQDAFPPRCKEDLSLLDYKCRNLQREMDFALVALQPMIRSSLTKEIVPLLRDISQKHHQKVQSLRKSIQKDQDALPILGMEIPLTQAAEIISQSGEDFDISGLHVKSLCTIAEYAQSQYWEIFCRLLVKAAQGSISNLLDSFSYNSKKGETIPITFLQHLKTWLEKKRPLDLQNVHISQIEEKFSVLKSQKSQNIS